MTALTSRRLWKRRVSSTISMTFRITGRLGRWTIRCPRCLFLILLAVLAGAETFTDIARFGEKKIQLLRRFRPYVNGL